MSSSENAAPIIGRNFPASTNTAIRAASRLGFNAWQVLVLRAKVAAGQTVLVMGAAGGVGSAAVQIAKLLGATVIAAAGLHAKLAKARALGADDIINYTDSDFARVVLELTGQKGVDVIVDPLGGSLWQDYLSCIRPGGKIVTCGINAGQTANVQLQTIIRNQISVIGAGPQGSKSAARDVLDLINRRRLCGIIDRVLPLEDAESAHYRLANR